MTDNHIMCIIVYLKLNLLQVFQILRFLVIEVSSKVTSDLPESKPYVRPPRISRREAKGEIVEGNPLPQ